MSDPQRDRPVDRDERETMIDEEATAIDDRGGLRDTAPNPHDEEGTAETAARATGAMTGMFLPAVILAIIAIAVILYFAL